MTHMEEDYVTVTATVEGDGLRCAGRIAIWSGDDGPARTLETVHLGGDRVTLDPLVEAPSRPGSASR